MLKHDLAGCSTNTSATADLGKEALKRQWMSVDLLLSQRVEDQTGAAHCTYRDSRLTAGSAGQADVRTWAVTAVVKSNFFLFFSDEDKNRRKENTAQPRRGSIEWSRKKRAFDLNSGSSLARGMFCSASGGPYRLNTAGCKQMIPHCMRLWRRFRVALVRVDRTLRLQILPSGQWSAKNARFTACRECIVFLQRNGWLWTRVYPAICWGFRHQPHRSCRFFLHVWVAAENELLCIQLCLRGMLHMLTCRDGLAKTFELQTCATQRKLRHSAMPTGGPKIDSGENCFPLKVANQLASYFYTSPGPIRNVVAKQPS